MIHYGGLHANNPGSLTVSNNTLIDDYSKPGAVIAVLNQTLNTNVTVSDNTFENNTPTTIFSGPGTVSANIAANATMVASSSSALPPTTNGTMNYSSTTAPVTYRFTSSGHTVIGGAGLLTVPNAGNNDIVLGGSGGVNFTGSGGMVYTVAGSSSTLTLTGAVTVQSAGNDAIVVQGNNALVTLDGTETVANNTDGKVQFFVRGDAAVNESGQATENVSVLSGGTLTEHGTTKSQAISDQGGTFTFNTGTNAGSFSGYIQATSVSAKTVSLTSWQIRSWRTASPRRPAITALRWMAVEAWMPTPIPARSRSPMPIDR